MTLPAFAAERRRPQRGTRSNRWISPAGWAHGSKPVSRPPLLLSIDGTDRQTDGGPTVA